MKNIPMKRNAKNFPFVTFLAAREYLDEEGIWNPKDGDAPVECGFQINVFGTRDHYLKLAEALKKFAEKDTSKDGDYHEHFEGLTSANGKVRLHVILRKDDVGNCTWKDYFPKS